MKKTFVFCVVSFLFYSGILYAQSVAAVFSSKSGDTATIVQTFNGFSSIGSVMFQYGGRQYSIMCQPVPYTTGGFMTSEPFRLIHTDFVSNGYIARRFDQDSPRKNQLDITPPSGKTVTYYYDAKLTARINSANQPPPAAPFSNYPNTSPPGGGNAGNNGNRQQQCPVCYGNKKCNYRNTYGVMYDYCQGGYTGCGNCSATGFANGRSCSVCNGTSRVKCNMCRGTGLCSRCNGKGYL